MNDHNNNHLSTPRISEDESQVSNEPYTGWDFSQYLSHQPYPRLCDCCGKLKCTHGHSNKKIKSQQ